MANSIKAGKAVAKIITAGKTKANAKNAASKWGTGMMTPPTITKGKVKDFDKNSKKAVVDALYGKTTPKQFKNIVKKDKKQNAIMDAMNYPTVKTPKVPVKKKAK